MKSGHNSDGKGSYFLYQNNSPDVDNSRTSLIFGSLLKCLKVLYHYTIASCLPNQSDDAEHIEMVNFSSGEAGIASKAAIRKREELIMKKKVNLHFEDHLQKWKRKKFPFKVMLHLLLLVLVTAQVRW